MTQKRTAPTITTGDRVISKQRRFYCDELGRNIRLLGTVAQVGTLGEFNRSAVTVTCDDGLTRTVSAEVVKRVCGPHSCDCDSNTCRDE